MFNLQNTIKINGNEYVIDTDFRIWLKFQKLIQQLKDNEESFYKLLSFFLEINLDFQINHLDETFKQVLEFFAYENNTNKSSGISTEKVFDFEKDEKYIYSAFLQEYNIDLYDIDYLHWHKFKSLLQSLSDNCQLTKIIQYRSIDISKMDKEQKKFYQKMKEIYSLDDKKEVMTTTEYHNNIRDKINKRFKEVEELAKKEV